MLARRLDSAVAAVSIIVTSPWMSGVARRFALVRLLGVAASAAVAPAVPAFGSLRRRSPDVLGGAAPIGWRGRPVEHSGSVGAGDALDESRAISQLVGLRWVSGVFLGCE